MASAADVPTLPASAAAVAGTPPLNGTDKAASPDGKLQKHSYDDMTRVSELSAAALHDLANSNFSTVAVNIHACWPAK
ncbi:hypothetical protein [Paraburkholderia sp. BL17N1]|uniref:hypothetical protein n=1 Tax=Paraburkholderia sp. BL17N1 TaxID=1938798 RepID=UPI000EAC03CE|nr:hypothetical protein [Paraburkholderia sp. BL17N1]RKR31170.1 hypothetical protein B0G82_7297 [Paraburkholderia sp. BL17N1]